MQLLIMKQDRGVHTKGDIVEVRATGTPFTGREPDRFVMVEEPDTPMAEYLHYNGSWERIIDYGIVASNLVVDGFRLRLFSPLVDSSLKGAITRAEVERFIQSWNGTVFSVSPNEVVFDLLIYDALKSAAFWEVDITGVIFTETSYAQATGIHTVEIDYNAIGNNPTYVEKYVIKKGATVVSHSGKVLTAEFTRADVRAEFEEDIRQKARRQIEKRRYRVPSGVVDAVIANGGTMTPDITTLVSWIEDKTAD